MKKFSSILVIFTVFSPFFITTYCVGSLLQESAQPTILFYSTEKPARFIIVEKKNQRLILVEQLNGLKLTKKVFSATGENPGNKKLRGDERTPEGVYYITDFHKDNKISVFGNRAFHLDYPNVFDTLAGSLGDGIYIHGTNRELTPNSTNGCITLRNSDLDELATYLTVNDIPIIILNTLTVPSLSKVTELEKNDNRVKEILKALLFNPENFPTDNITNLYFIKNGSQAIADIHYYVYEKDHIRYQIHKRVYLIPALTDEWQNMLTLKTDSIPTILALHPKKNN